MPLDLMIRTGETVFKHKQKEDKKGKQLVRMPNTKIIQQIMKIYSKLIVLFLLFIFAFTQLQAQKRVIVHDTVYIEQHMDKLLENRLTLLEKENDSFHQLIDNTTASVSNSISASDRTINSWGYCFGIFSILLSIFGIFIGVYVTSISKKVENMLETVNNKETEIKNIHKIVKTSKNEVSRINKQINNNLAILYDKLRKEESKALINRLIEEPLDIGNLDTLLLSRKLDDDLYNDLKRAYSNGLKDESFDNPRINDYSYNESYLLLFFQHFPYQAILDDDLWKQLMEKFSICSDCAFKSDILYTTSEICKALNEEQTPFNKEELLVKYLEAINSSRHNKYTEIANIFNNQLRDTKLLKSAIENCKKNNVYLYIFGIEPRIENTSIEGNADT